MRFEDVEKCKDVAEYLEFVNAYCEEKKLFQGTEEYHKTVWALHYRWLEK